ncbi:MAG: hypothetical protein GY758_23100 [Fuerstiella sp.]|nr:hypothetical protein [Fuerstiella sp.]MCP4512016.1 hypothetical protein [Fuerstiella sp.]
MEFQPYVTFSVPTRGFRDVANPLAAVEVQDLHGVAFDRDAKISWFDLTADLQGSERATSRRQPAAPQISFELSDRV